MRTLQRFAACQSGATAIEYSLMVALIAIAIVAATQSVGTQLQEPFRDVESGFKGE